MGDDEGAGVDKEYDDDDDGGKQEFQDTVIDKDGTGNRNTDDGEFRKAVVMRRPYTPTRCGIEEHMPLHIPCPVLVPPQYCRSGHQWSSCCRAEGRQTGGGGNH